MYSPRLHGSLVLVCILLAAFLFAQTIKTLKEYQYVGGGVAATNVINVSGEGEVFAVPDTTEFTFSVIEEGDTVSAIQEAATTKANDVIDALKAEGVDEQHIKVVAYELHPKYEYRQATCVRYPCERKRIQTGFVLNESIRIKITDIDKAGSLLQLVTSKEVDSVTGLSFTIADENAVQEEARKMAIDEAQAKAQKLADDLGVSLARIVGFSENSNQPILYAADTAKAVGLGRGGIEATPVPTVPAGENRITSNVHITYEIR